MERIVNFGGHLKALRAGENKFGKKFSQKQVAESCSVARSAISEYENGIKEPTLSVIVAIAKFFEISIDELVFGNAERVDN
jgi:transcriptional regulator with XRE-family HTH domain